MKGFLQGCADYGKFLLQWIRVGWQMAFGIIKLNRVKPPRITFFGGTRLTSDSKYTKSAYQLAAKLAGDNIAILTGGGLGLMEAANCGAQSVESTSANIGITVKGLDREKLKNTCSKDVIVMDYFFARKWLLMNYSTGFVVFPGGFGTVDEFAEVVTLFQTNKLRKVPIILFGKDYWDNFIKWFKESALACHLVSEDDINMITITDDIEFAYTILNEECRGECLIKG